MNKFNVQVSYRPATGIKGGWTGSVSTVLAETRKDACLLAMAKISKAPDGIYIDPNDIKHVDHFWTFKFGSKINDPENGDVKPGNL